MKIDINVNDEQWQAIADNCSGSTFFHTPTWKNFVAEIHPEYESVPVLCTDNSNNRLLFPLWKVGESNKTGLYEYQSGVMYTYGGYISEGDWVPEQMDGVIEEMTHHKELRVGSIIINGNPYINQNFINIDRAEASSSHVLHLDKDIESLRKDYSKGHKSGYKKAVREKITVRQGYGEKDWLNYYEIYIDSLRRWGDSATSKYSWEFFESLLIREGEKIKLWLAERGDEVCSGAVVLYQGRIACYWLGSSKEECFSTRASNLLQDQIIEDAIKNGLKYYDMMGSGGHAGVVKFKEGFGAKDKSYDSYVWNCGLQRKIQSGLANFKNIFDRSR